MLTSVRTLLAALSLSAASVAFARKRLDICRSFAAAHADLDFSFEELGVAPNTLLFVLNPLNGP